MVLSMGPLDWEASALTTRPVLLGPHKRNYRRGVIVPPSPTLGKIFFGSAFNLGAPSLEFSFFSPLFPFAYLLAPH